jgi:hypothetical protein
MERSLYGLRPHRFSQVLMLVMLMNIIFSGCRKEDRDLFHFKNDPAAFSSQVIDKWITMQLRLMRDATGIPNVAFSRYYAYSGIAAFEALAPDGSPGSKWNGLTGLPQAGDLSRYYWPACVNGALASMNRSIFIHANASDSAAIDSLENALNASFGLSVNEGVITTSGAFGKNVAAAVFNWAETDGYKNASIAYTPPVGPGLWVPTPPAFAAASTPYWGENRPMVAGSIEGTQPGPPIPYSEDPASPFFLMVKQVYDASQQLTPDQTAMALFWRDVPGVSSPGHWLSILQQVIARDHSRLDKAAFAYAITGVCLSDACISVWQTKYRYNQVRPVTYIQDVMGYPTWTPLLTTPAHPEYSSAHAVLSAAAADAFTAVFGQSGSFTDHTYDYLAFAPRTFNSFGAIAVDAGNSRLYAGIHYQPSIDTGLIQGRKVTANILKRLASHASEYK